MGRPQWDGPTQANVGKPPILNQLLISSVIVSLVRSAATQLCGFTIGNDPTDDLPASMLVPVEKQAIILHRYLSNDKMFPRNSSLASCITASNGGGHIALCNIIHLVHPLFQ